MANNQFFKNKGPFPLKKIINEVKSDLFLKDNHIIEDIQNLDKASNNEITFLHTAKYKELSKNTKALACITSQNLSKYLPSKCLKVIVKNVLFASSKVLKLFYPEADIDHPDIQLQIATDFKERYKDVSFGKHVLIGKDVKIGEGSHIGSSTIVESNVEIGKNCNIGSHVIIKNSVIEDDVHIQAGSKIGIKGFGFIPNKNKNIRTPHIGKVILKRHTEIGAGCTIDRGSLSDTEIGENTFLDNLVHVAHNVKIGKNCMIAGQVGFAGSTTVGDNVIIGGQAGISGHLTIGNNVKIGGGSGVINNIPDNYQIMGYPAVPLKDFIKQRKINEK